MATHGSILDINPFFQMTKQQIYDILDQVHAHVMEEEITDPAEVIEMIYAEVDEFYDIETWG